MSDAEGVLDPVGVYGSVETAQKVLEKATAEIKAGVPLSKIGPILRAAFHDSATYEQASRTGGVNGSLRFEVMDPFNAGLIDGFVETVDVRNKLMGDGFAITFADLIQLAGAVMVEMAGGPHIPVQMGRSDVAHLDDDFPNKIPDEQFGAKDLLANMESHGFSKRDTVALSGAHTVGNSRYHDPLGPMKVTAGVAIAANELVTFNNVYFKQLLINKAGRFPADSALVQDPEMLAIVEEYAKDQDAFFRDFVASYLKMGLLGVNMEGVTPVQLVPVG